MRTLVALLSLSFAVLLFSTGEGFALPPCPEDENQWFDNCFGSFTYANGDKYVGEWKDDLRHGQGTLTYADGRSKEGVWKKDEYQDARKDPKVEDKLTSSHAEIVKLIDGRSLKLKSDGTYEFVESRATQGIVGEEKIEESGDVDTEKVLELAAFMEMTRAKQFSVKGVFDNQVLDILQDLNQGDWGAPQVTVSGRRGTDEYAMFKAECPGVPCTVEGHLELFPAPMVGPELVFVVERYDTNVSGNSIDVKDLLSQVLGKTIALESYAVWLSDIDFFLLTETPDKSHFTRNIIRVVTDSFDRFAKVDLIKKCYKKCKKVRVVGRLNDWHGVVQIVAEKITKLD